MEFKNNNIQLSSYPVEREEESVFLTQLTGRFPTQVSWNLIKNGLEPKKCTNGWAFSECKLDLFLNICTGTTLITAQLDDSETLLSKASWRGFFMESLMHVNLFKLSFFDMPKDSWAVAYFM